MTPVILFVDDEPNILSGIKRMLREKRKEWEMIFTESGHKALEIMKEKKVDIVVSDMRMPEMDGSQLLDEVKKLYPDTIRIILSGYAERDSLMRAASTTHRYLAKPCEKDLLLSTINSTLKMKERLDNDKVRKLLTGIQALPSPRQTCLNLIKELNNPNSNAKTIADIIAADVALTAKILQLVNSAYFGINNEITSAQTAVSLLGLDIVSSVALNAGILFIFDEYNIEALSEKLSKKGFLVGELAQKIAEEEVPEDEKTAEKAFTSGLVHEVGTLFLAGIMPKNYATCMKCSEEKNGSIWSLEQECFGATHAYIGAYLLGIWGIPDDIVEAVMFHHSPEELENRKDFDLVTIMQITSALVNDDFNEKLTNHIVKIGKKDRLQKWKKWLEELQKKR